MTNPIRGILKIIVLGFAGAPFSGMAWASLTTVYGPPGSEHTHAQILSHLYGGNFVGVGFSAPSYTNGTVTAIRVDDVTDVGGIGSDLHLVSGTAGLPVTDQQWVDGIAITSAEARFAAYSQQFGYDDGGGYVNLFNVTGSGYNVTGSATHQFGSSFPWAWMRSGQGGTWSSVNSANSDKQDHMVTYAITGLPDLSAGETVWLLFWEDLTGPFNPGKSDRDFNDLVVEVHASIEAIPLPSAAALSGVGLGLVLLVVGRGLKLFRQTGS